MSQDDNTPEWVRMKVVDSQAVGKFIVDLALHPEKRRPKNVSQLKSELGGAVIFNLVQDDTPVTFIDTPMNEIVIRLPPKAMVEDALKTFIENFNMAKYPIPDYVSNILGGNITPQELFFRRIGDYTTSECA